MNASVAVDPQKYNVDPSSYVLHSSTDELKLQAAVLTAELHVRRRIRTVSLLGGSITQQMIRRELGVN